MVREALSRPLARLIDRLDAACIGASDEIDAAVSAALTEAAAAPGLLTPEQMQGNPERYARHLLHGDPLGRYSIVSLVWGPGQFSPVHGHYTWCGYVVVAGRLHEETYLWAGDPKAAVLQNASDRLPGDRRFAHAGLDQIHRLGNSGAAPAVSIHVYGVDQARVGSHVNRVVKSA